MRTCHRKGAAVRTRRIIRGCAVICVLALAGAIACTPKVEVTPSDKPITINLNVKIDHEIRVKVDKELDKVLSENSGLF
ncbi:YnbE family lipoprotein [Nitrospira sp.]|nr:YnbE family lipoprotein [Nitrospira sp.]